MLLLRLPGRPSAKSTVLTLLFAGVALAALALTPGSARAAQGPTYLSAKGNCVEGTYKVPHGVTQITVDASGASGTDGPIYERFDNYGNPIGANYGGRGGYGSRVQATIPVTPGQTLYIGVASDGGTNLIPGGAGSTNAGKGGAASWISDTDPRVGGGCALPDTQVPGEDVVPGRSHLLLVAAGGGGGGEPASKPYVNGGAGGTESSGGGGASFPSYGSNGGSGGSPGTTTAGGGGGVGGHSFNCTSGVTGAAGSSMQGGSGGDAGEWSLSGYTDIYFGLIAIPDCSQPPRGSSALPTVGGGGGGGGGGYFGGGGGGGSEDSGLGGGGGGASGSSFALNATSMSVGRWTGLPSVYIAPVTQAPSFTSADHTTVTVGSNASFIVQASAVNTAYISATTTPPAGLSFFSERFADGDGTGRGFLQGTPQPGTGGVWSVPMRACNLASCVDQPFTLTVNEAPAFTSRSAAVFKAGQPGSFTVTTNGWPKPAISQTGAPAWLSLTDNHDGTATLSGTPPVSGAANSYTVNLTASNGIGSSATQTFTIPVVTALSVTPQDPHMVAGFLPTFADYPRGWHHQFKAIGTRPDGGTADVTGAVVWSSSDTSAATITTGGLVTTPAMGTSTITASTASSLAATSSLVVAMPKSITVTPASTTLIHNQQQQYHATGCYGDPCSTHSFDISDFVTWSMLNGNKYSSVNDSGVVTGGSGTDYVMATMASYPASPGFVTGEAPVAVTHGKVVSITLSQPTARTILKNATTTFAATVKYEDGTLDSNFSVTWSAQDVTGSGVTYVPPAPYAVPSFDFSGLSVGTATITASVANPGGPTVSATAALKVISVPSSLSIALPSGVSPGSIVKGKTQQYVATAVYTDGSPDQDVTKGVTWSSDSPSVATVSSDGIVAAVGTSDGASARIRATYTYKDTLGNSVTVQAYRDVTITVLPPVSIAITPTAVPTTLHPFDTQQFTAIGTYADGSTLDLTRMVTWDYDSSAIGTVSSAGLLSIRDKAQGTETVQASFRSVLFSNKVTVTVTDPLDHVLLTTDSSYRYQIAAGQVTGGLHVEGYDARGSDLGDVTYKSTFAISPDGTCNSSGQYCGANVAGTHTITATTPDAVHPNSTNSASLLVTRAATTRIEVTGGSDTIYAGSRTAAYHVTSYDRFGNSADATNQTSFRISPVETTSGCDRTVGGQPTCFAQSLGSHTVTATYDSGLSDQQIVTRQVWVDPSLFLSSVTLTGGPPDTGAGRRVAVGGASLPYVANFVDRYGNRGSGNALLTITPDGTCDSGAMTCTPANPGLHTVTASSFDGSVVSNSVTFTAVPADHIQLNRGSVVVSFNGSTDPYQVEGFGADGYDLGDVTAVSSLSISPDGSCDDTTHTCKASVGDTGGSQHTVTATYGYGTNPTAARGLIVTGPTSLQLVGSGEPVRAGDSTHPFIVWALDGDGNQMALMTNDAPLSIAPDGTCDNSAHTCSATVAGPHTVTATFAPDGGTPVTDTFNIDVVPNPVVDHIVLRGGSSSIAAGGTTAPYQVVGVDAYGNDDGDLTFASGLSMVSAGGGGYHPCDEFATYTCTATDADSGGGHHTVTAYVAGPDGGYFASRDLTVNPGPVDHLLVTGGSDSIPQFHPTNPYVVHGVDAFGNDTGDVTAESSLSIAPDGSCDDVAHTCTGISADFYNDSSDNSRHTITATYQGKTGTSTVFVTPSSGLSVPAAPFVWDTTDEVSKGSFTLIWWRVGDPERDPVTYTLQHKSTAPGSDWVTIDSRIPEQGPEPYVSYDLGGTYPREQEGSWTYRVIATVGYQETTGPESDVFTVDRTAPTASDDFSGAWNDGTNPPHITLTADDGSGSGIANIYYTMGVNPPDPTTSSARYSAPFFIPNGQEVKYFAVDNAGNAGPVETSARQRIDYTLPTTTDNVDSNWHNQPVTVTLTASDSESGIDKTYYEISDASSGPPIYPTTSSPVYDPSNKPVLQNYQYIGYFSVDKAGNAEQPRFSNVAQVDDTAPFTWSDVPVEEAFSNFAVTLYASDDYPGSGICHTQYVLVAPGVHYDLANFSTDAVEYDSGNKPVLPDQNWKILFRSIDCMGNVEPIETSPFKIDQGITFTSAAPDDAHIGDTYSPTAIADSGLSITYTASGACGMNASGDTVLMLQRGTCTVTARQDGDLTFNPTDTVTQSFNVAVPQVPTNLQASGGVRSVALTWGPPVGTGGSSITGYLLTVSAGSTVFSKAVGTSVCTGSPVVCSFTFTGLASGTNYTVTAAARTSAATGPTASASATTFALPSAPQSFAATPGDGQASLSWAPPASDGGSAVTAYRLRLYVNNVLQSTTDLDPAATCSGGSCADVLTGLTNGTRYSLALSAVTAVGSSSVAWLYVTPFGSPDAPANLQATGALRGVTLSWSPPAGNGGFAITGYTLTATAGSKTISAKVNASSVCAGSPVVCSYTLAGLANGTNYTVTAAARTSAATGPTASASATTFALASAPQSLAATPGDGQASLTWTPPASDGGTAVTAYRLRLFLNNVLQSTTDLDPAATCSGGSCAYVLTGLTNGTRYSLALTATNAVGAGPAANIRVTPLGLAAAPPGLQATAGVRKITLTWFPLNNPGGAPVTAYVVTATTGSTVITKNVGPGFCTGAPAVCSYTLSGLSNGTAYALTVSASTIAGTGSPASASATTLGVASAPQNLSAVPGDGQAALSWTAPSSDGGSPITGYQLRVSVGSVIQSTLTIDLSNCSGGTCGYTLTPLSDGTKYSLRLVAVNAVGSGPAVNVTVTPHA